MNMRGGLCEFAMRTPKKAPPRAPPQKLLKEGVEGGDGGEVRPCFGRGTDLTFPCKLRGIFAFVPEISKNTCIIKENVVY